MEFVEQELKDDPNRFDAYVAKAVTALGNLKKTDAMDAVEDRALIFSCAVTDLVQVLKELKFQPKLLKHIDTFTSATVKAGDEVL